MEPGRQIPQSLCNHDEKQVHHQVFHRGYCLPIRPWRVHDLPSDRSSRYAQFIPSSFWTGADENATSFSQRTLSPNPTSPTDTCAYTSSTELRS